MVLSFASASGQASIKACLNDIKLFRFCKQAFLVQMNAG